VLGDPRVYLGRDQLLQLADLQIQLLDRDVGRRRRVRPHLRAVPGHHVHGDQPLPGAPGDRGDQQALDRLLVPAD
jgi:hypothetical protein